MLSRFKSAARILLKGDSKKKKRNPIPAIAPEEVAEIRQFFPREKFFIFGHARSGTTLLMRLVRLHPEVHCNYQAHFFTRQPLLKSLVDTPAAAEGVARQIHRREPGRRSLAACPARRGRLHPGARRSKGRQTYRWR